MIDDLYSAKILTLVANMPRAGRLAAPDASAEKTAKLCGSTIVVDVMLDSEGKVADFAQDVAACALGQAAAAVLGANVIGAGLSDIELARDSLAAMLKSNGSPPRAGLRSSPCWSRSRTIPLVTPRRCWRSKRRWRLSGRPQRRPKRELAPPARLDPAPSGVV